MTGTSEAEAVRDGASAPEPGRTAQVALLGANVGAALGFAAALADIASSALAGGGAGFAGALGIALLLILWGQLLGILTALWFAGVERLSSRLGSRAKAWTRAALGGLPLILFFVWVPSNWIVEHWPELAMRGRALAVSVELLLLLGGVVAARLVCALAASAWLAKPLVRFALAGTLLFGAALFYVADARVLVDLYDEFHDGLHAAFLVQLAACFVLLRASVARTVSLRVNAALHAGLALLVLLTLLLDLAPTGAAVRASGALSANRAIAVLRAGSDLDGDGFSGLLSGGDCAGFDSARAPGRFDVPGNGLDEDCSGEDSRWPKFERGTPAAAPQPDKNVVLITIDTLRADRLSLYGHSRPTSPNIDALGSKSWVFNHAYSQSSKTFDSIPSFMTGLYPTNLARDYVHLRAKKVKEYVYTLGRDSQTLADLLNGQDYDTRAFGAFELLRQLGLDRGFDKFSVGRQQVAGSIKYLKTVRSPFFLWVHFDEPHEPYVAHPKQNFGSKELDRYDSEIAFVDQLVGQILDALTERGLDEHTVIALTADHGEEFGEHGGRFHAPKLYEELLHVPLIIRVPGQQPARIEEIVELVDLAPTLCESVLSPLRCAGYDGQSLWDTVAGKRHKGFGFDGAYGESLFSRALSRFQNRSLVNTEVRFNQRINKNALELYDRKNDPTESRNAIGDQLLDVTSLRGELLMRPYRMLGSAFERAAAGDTSALVAALPRIRELPMLGHALQLLEEHPSKGLAGALRKVGDRPELSPELKQRVKRLLQSQK
jgi:arylsulfatase A-like enzyme